VRRLTTAIAFLAPIALAATFAVAGDDAHGGIPKGEILPPVKQGLPAMLASFITFLVVLGIMAKMVWPQILKGLNDREAKIKEEIESAELARQQAKDALEQYQQSLAQARAEAQKMLESTKAQQAALAAELKAKADAEVAALREKAMRDIETAKRAALAEIYGQATTLATTMAGKILSRQVSTDDTQRLLDESVSQLQSMRN
jgi:F-type H+-transporting ATPase subunit b